MAERRLGLIMHGVTGRMGYFYVSNMKTLSVIFGKDLSTFALIQEREAQAVQMVLDYLRAGR